MKWLNYLFASICIVIIFLMLYYRAQIELYFALLFDTQKEFSAEKYPVSINSIHVLFTYKYKWSFTLFFTFIYSLCSFGCVWFLFPYRSVARTMLFIYLAIFLMMIGFALLSLLMNNYAAGFGIVYYLKKLVQTPYLSLFLILYYWKINNPNRYK